MGPLFKVHGDVQPATSYVILAPRVQLVRESLLAAQQFMTQCASFKSLQLQLQVGRTAVINPTSKK